MRAVDLIRKKRDGQPLGREEIDVFVRGVTDGSLPDYQVAAWLMAVVLRGMSLDETWWLTDAMTRSGDRLEFGRVSGAVVDKHSTGGVGDKTSLVVAPLAAACGVVVPMMSGRALGHTGGTSDKLEAIPGFRTQLDPVEVARALARVGCAMIGQSKAIAPADRRLYALRDATATVESLPLISASILSKKLAEGLDGLVLDVKTGRGAFMKTEREARELADWLVSLGRRAKVRTEAVITPMDTPLGRTVGNAMEVVEALEVLKGRGPADVEGLSVVLAARMVRLAGLEDSIDAAERGVRRALDSGAGLEKLRDIVVNQGGDPAVVDDYTRLPMAPNRRRIEADRSGFVVDVNAWRIGFATAALGAGRDCVDAAVDHAVGIRVIARRGDAVSAGDPVLDVEYTATRPPLRVRCRWRRPP